jgi:hypothetical protein
MRRLALEAWHRFLRRDRTESGNVAGISYIIHIS